MNKISYLLAALLLLVTANSIWFFFGVLKVEFVEWFVFNACAPSNTAFLIGFVIYVLTKDRTVLHMAILPIFFFGGLGLYLFPWGGYNLIPQISHIIMVLNAAWVIYETFKRSDFKAATLGMLLGIVVFSVFINFQQIYANTHPEALKNSVGVDLKDFQKKYFITSEN